MIISGFDEISKNVALQGDEEQRVHRHAHTEQTYRQRIHRILAHQRGRERNERLEHQEERVKANHSVSGMTREGEQMMVVQLKLADDDEADHPVQEFRDKIDKFMAEFADAAAFVERGHFEFENEQRHHDREDAVTKRLDAIERQLAPGKASEQPRSIWLRPRRSAGRFLCHR